MRLIRGVLVHRKNLVKKRAEIRFYNFIKNRYRYSKFVFRFDNEKENEKKNRNSISI